MNTEIYYLSGTGNSLHVAKEMQKKLPDARLIPLAALKNREKISTEREIVGFIFPVHFMTAPAVIFQILKRMDLDSAKYIFIITTRHGTPCNIMYERFERILKKKGKRLDSYATITMPSNDPKFKNWKLSSQDDLDAFEDTLQKKLDLLHGYIMKQVAYHEPDHEVKFKVNPVVERFVVFVVTLIGGGRETFYHDSNCTGCGMCETICLSSKIKMVDGKPQWQKKPDCYSCYACMNYCPNHSIQVKSTPVMKFYTEENGRYHHSNIPAGDIASQKFTEALG